MNPTAPSRIKVRFHDEDLQALRMRLQRTRWPATVPKSGWKYGTDAEYLRKLVDYWQHKYDWRRAEDRINTFTNIKSFVDGDHLHAIHEKSPSPDAIPILLVHGWPSSFIEFIPMIRPLTSPPEDEQSFHVVIASLPGFGLSGHQTKDMGCVEAARLLRKMMVESLGYERFAVHGGDFGANVANAMGLQFPGNLLGLHALSAIQPDLASSGKPLSQAEHSYMKIVERWERDHGAYLHLQQTQPQTLSFALNDSPVGLCSWIVEKMRSWSDCDGDVERCFTKDVLLDNVTLYWLTETIGSANRYYFGGSMRGRSLGTIDVPARIYLTLEEVDKSPIEWAQRSYTNLSWAQAPAGGHFLAWEQPELLIDDLRAFFGSVHDTAPG